MKKRSERRKHRAGCSKAEPKIFAPLQALSRGRATAKIHHLYLQSQFGEFRCMQFQIILLTDPQTRPQTGPITIHCAAAYRAV